MYSAEFSIVTSLPVAIVIYKRERLQRIYQRYSYKKGCIIFTGETTSAGNLLPGSRHLTQSLSVRGHVRKDDQHVLLALVGEELSGRKGQTRGDDSLNGRVVGQVEEEAHVLHGAILLEVLLEEASCLHVDSHGGEYNGEVVLMVIQD